MKHYFKGLLACTICYRVEDNTHVHYIHANQDIHSTHDCTVQHDDRLLGTDGGFCALLLRAVASRQQKVAVPTDLASSAGPVAVTGHTHHLLPQAGATAHHRPGQLRRNTLNDEDV